MTELLKELLEELHDLKERDPFAPFVIILKDGRRISVTRRTQYGFSEHLMGVFDDSDRLDSFSPSDIAEIQVSHPVT